MKENDFSPPKGNDRESVDGKVITLLLLLESTKPILFLEKSIGNCELHEIIREVKELVLVLYFSREYTVHRLITYLAKRNRWLFSRQSIRVYGPKAGTCTICPNEPNIRREFAWYSAEMAGCPDRDVRRDPINQTEEKE